MFLFIVFTLVAASYLWLRHRYSYWERLVVPGPKPVYIFGNLFKQLTFQEHISTAYQRWHNTYNNVPYVGFYKLLQPAVMIRDPELQREVLVKSFTHFQDNDITLSYNCKKSPFRCGLKRNFCLSLGIRMNFWNRIHSSWTGMIGVEVDWCLAVSLLPTKLSQCSQQCYKWVTNGRSMFSVWERMLK